MKLFKSDKSKHITWGIILAILCWVIFSLVSMFLNKPTEALSGKELSDFSWLAGTWSGEFGGGNFTETWNMDADQKMVGSGLFKVSNETVFGEQLTLQSVGDKIVYITIPENEKPVLFTLTDIKGKSWTFENEEHNYPKKIVYTVKEDGSLFIEVKGRMLGLIPISDNYLLKRQ